MLQGPHNVTSFQIANCNIMGSGTVMFFSFPTDILIVDEDYLF